MPAKLGFRGGKGDRVVVEGRKLGVGSRAGAILEVLGEPGAERSQLGRRSRVRLHALERRKDRAETETEGDQSEGVTATRAEHRHRAPGEPNSEASSTAAR